MRAVLFLNRSRAPWPIAILLVLLTGCAVHSPPSYSDSSLTGNYLLTTNERPLGGMNNGPHLASGAILFDGRGKLIGRQRFVEEKNAEELSGTYVIEADGSGVAHIVVRRHDGRIREEDYVIHIENPHRALMICDGPAYIAWNDPHRPPIDARIIKTIIKNDGTLSPPTKEEKRKFEDL